jgi:hypothetical protein
VDTYRKLGSPRSAEEIQNVLRPFRTNFKATTDAYVRGMFGAGADEQLVQQVATNMAAAPPEIAVPALQSSLTFGRDITEVPGGDSGSDIRNQCGGAPETTCSRCNNMGWNS